MTIIKRFPFLIIIRSYCKNTGGIMKFLNVAEKNDAAKNIAGFLSRGTARRVIILNNKI